VVIISNSNAVLFSEALSKAYKEIADITLSAFSRATDLEAVHVWTPKMLQN